jgi:hypothetical protein
MLFYKVVINKMKCNSVAGQIIGIVRGENIRENIRKSLAELL